MAVPLVNILSGLVAALTGMSPPCLMPPVAGRVIDPFRPPACTFCAGNRGIEYETTAGSPVIAAASGTVSFAGSVAGTRYVVIDHRDGFRTTYGRLGSIEVRSGTRVSSGTTIAVAGTRTFFGLRLGDDYLDPAPHLATVTPQPRLVPLDGRHRLAPPPPRVAC